jgi:hypothetical protein
METTEIKPIVLNEISDWVHQDDVKKYYRKSGH